MNSEANITIYLERIKNNFKILQNSKYKHVLPVLKSGCYGMDPNFQYIPQALYSAGCRDYSVGYEYDANMLHNNLHSMLSRSNKSYQDINIFILYPVIYDSLAICAQNNYIIPIYDNSGLLQILDYNKKSECKIQHVILYCDCNMGRGGFAINQIPEIYKLCIQNNINVKMLMAHYSLTDWDKYEAQVNTLNSIADKYDMQCIRSFATSHMVFSKRFISTDSIRVGAGLYIEHCSHTVDTISSKAQIISYHDLHAGQTVGYYGTYKCMQQSRIAVLNLGYSNGFFYNYSDDHCFYKGTYKSFVGRICMDSSMININGFSDHDLQIGDDVEIIGDNIKIMDIVNRHQIQTGYALCSLSSGNKRYI